MSRLCKRSCGRPLADANSSGVCYRCQQARKHPPATPCARCGAKRRSGCVGTLCHACKKNGFCRTCRRETPAPGGQMCRDCRALTGHSTQRRTIYQTTTPEHEARIVYYTERAALRQPLFEGILVTADLS